VDYPDGPTVDRVRADLARLGDDTASAPEVPASVTVRVVTALRAEPLPRRRVRRRTVRLSAVVGVAAAGAAVVVGSVMVARPDVTGRTSAQHLADGPSVPLSDAQILDLLRRPPELGALADSRRRASCLSGLGYSGSTAVLGAQPVDIDGSAAVLLILPGDARDTLAALAVRPNCSSADTGLLADTQVRRP
jgi:hypothetical protein